MKAHGSPFGVAIALFSATAFARLERLPQSAPDLRAGSFTWSLTVQSERTHFEVTAGDLGILAFMVPDHIQNQMLGVKCRLAMRHGSRMYGRLPVPFEKSLLICDMKNGEQVVREGPECAADRTEDSSTIAFAQDQHQLGVELRCSKR